MAEMTRRERLRRAFFHEEMDRPGVYSRPGFPEGDPTYHRLREYLTEHTDLKRDWYPGVVLEPWNKTTQYIEPISEQWERRITVLETPAGEFRASWLNSLKGQPGMPETHYIKSRDDAERWISLPMPEIDGDVSSFHAAVEEMGDDGIVVARSRRNPAGWAAELMGSETFAYMSVTDRGVVHAICERRMHILLAQTKHLLANGVGPFFTMSGHERIAPRLHGPKDFWDFNVRYDIPINDLIHENGGATHIHCHGALALVFDGILEMGVDVLHPVEPPPMGDLPADVAKERARGRLTIEGNIQVAHMYEHTPDEIRAETEALIRDAFASDRKGLIVSPTDSPWIRGAGEAAFATYQTMVDAVVNWRR